MAALAPPAAHAPATLPPRAHAVRWLAGTLVASRLQALHPARVHSLCMIDPVCIAMYMPRLLNSFIYRRPRVDFSK